MNLSKYTQLFVDQAHTHLAEMGAALVALERDGSASESAEAIDVLFRMAHSVKGMAASLGFDPVTTLAHGLEDWMDPFRGGESPTREDLDLLDDTITALEKLVAGVSEAGRAPPLDPTLLARLERSQSPPDRKPVPRERDPLTTSPRGSIAVQGEQLDRFLASVGELVQRQARIEALHRRSPIWEGHAELGEELERTAHAIRELRRSSLELRTTPVRGRFQRLPRVAARLARDLGKQVVVEIRGAEVEVDRALLDSLEEPLLHLLRNAVDHGLESPAARTRAGKDPTGRISIRVDRVGSRLRLCLEDDGAGIDFEAIRRRAVERGFLPQAVAEDLPPEQVAQLIFEAGLSCRDDVGSVSGRGVGLDAARRAIEASAGSIELSSVAGIGTRCVIDLPLMVALQRVLVLEVGGEAVALPSASIASVVSAREGRLERSANEAFFVWKDEPIPVLDLARRVGVTSRVPDRDSSLVVLENRGLRFGLRVDRAVADREVFVRNVPAALESVDGVAGVAILPEGVPTFLLDVAQLFGEAG